MEENDYLCTENSNFKSFMDFKAVFKRYNTNISEMAEALGLQQPSLSRSIKDGTITIKRLEQMADICGVSLGEFVGADMPDEITIKTNGKEYTYELKK